jgi:hypothetical protein
MKKYLLILLAAFVTSSIVVGQKIKDADVPGAVSTAFSKIYPGNKPNWEKEKGNYEASFKKDGKRMSATFQPTGVFLESETNIKESELPESVLTYIKENYKGKKIKDCAKITDANNVVTYEAGIDGKDVIFDSNGKFLKEEED